MRMAMRDSNISSPTIKDMVVGKPLNEPQQNVINRHFASFGNKAELSRLRIDDTQSSVYNPRTARLHVHKHDRRMSGKQELVFDSAGGRATSLTSHTLKLWDRRRHASAREYARIQGFPECFLLPKHLVANLFGNAVAVPCAAHACRSVVGGESPPPRTFLDLCSGIGGFHIAAQTAFPGIRCVGFCDVKPAAVECYRENFPDVPPLGDVKLVSEWPKADLLTAGFPCQPFSRACDIKVRARHKDRLFYEHVFDAIDASSPSYVVLENVRSLACPTGRPQLDAILNAFRSRGYQTDYRILDAADFGLPQQRHRIYIIARREETTSGRLEILPAPSCDQTTLGDILQDD
jgi:site-specific DNA-cytosine methylase